MLKRISRHDARIAVVAAVLAMPAPGITWDHAERPRPATLRDCPAKTKITINYSNHAYGPYRSFCYWGIK